MLEVACLLCWMLSLYLAYRVGKSLGIEAGVEATRREFREAFIQACHEAVTELKGRKS